MECYEQSRHAKLAHTDTCSKEHVIWPALWAKGPTRDVVGVRIFNKENGGGITITWRKLHFVNDCPSITLDQNPWVLWVPWVPRLTLGKCEWRVTNRKCTFCETRRRRPPPSSKTVYRVGEESPAAPARWMAAPKPPPPCSLAEYIFED